ncbi:PD-(D/E)XK nuclease family protein [Herbiconiux moechotypicola]|uniref:Exonuclease n=1 Tax=Herbiconiux moechotypicola TaxID=637393 RepID=A0ABN3DG55_9MICO|nr:PD-(D/E)XK nuclease family protein [Herbiconiux moechotypicola]MCS5729507.1 PD-(D/E)XK nuclease family protein [Herbiconiux moechotypicola]
MTTPKVNTIKRGDSRFYVEPETGEKAPGVTSVLGMLPKPFLQRWAAKMVAEEVVADLGTAVNLTIRNPEAAVDHLKNAPYRNTRAAADTGTAAHDLFERLAKGETIGRVSAEMEPYVRHFSEFLDTVQPEYHFMEETVWSDSRGPQLAYAGSFDAFATINGERIWLDNKTTRSGVHEEVGLQLAAYRYADHIIRPDGSRIPMPKADGGAVVHVRPEGWKLVPVKADEESFDVFLLLRQIFNWERDGKSSVVGRPVASGPADAESGPKRRTPRARAAVAA